MSYITYSSQELQKIVITLRQGGVVVFPTDTVWGVGALLSSQIGIDKFYAIKGRELTKPSQVLVSSIEMAKRYGQFNLQAENIARQYWPGALTIVVQAHLTQVPSLVRASGDTVGLRVPDFPLLYKLLTLTNEAIVASSANFAGSQAPKVFEAIDPALLELVDGVIQGRAGGQESSTVVDVSKEENIQILRQGKIKIS